MIFIPPDIVADMIRHAGEQAPVEACGLLVGVGVEVTDSYRLTNVDASSEHFSLDPKEQFAVIKDIRPKGWDVLAVYHSHPETPARMSQEDLRLALAPEMRYVIVSLAGEEPQVKCFTVWEGRPLRSQ
jgi:proteasome lid subunit RPN8/RPN11